MFKKNDRYVIEEIKRINWQYYKVKVHNKYYLVDYSDPSKLTNYFIKPFANLTREWTVYDITEIQDQYKEKKESYVLKNLKNLSTFIILLFILNGMLFSSFINLAQLTKDHRISKYWLLFLSSIPLGAIIMFIFLNLSNVPKINIEGTEAYILKQVGNKNTYTTKIIASVFYVLSIFFSILIGIAGDNYGTLIMFGYLGTYLILFNKFFYYSLDKETHKYQIIKKEEK